MPSTYEQEALRVKFVDLPLFRMPIRPVRPPCSAIRLAGSRHNLNDNVAVDQSGEKEAACFRLPKPQLTMAFQIG